VTIFLATLGQRPEAITVALDTLVPRYHYSHIGVIHTDPIGSGIADSYHTLMPILRRDYLDCEIVSHDIRTSYDMPLMDITDQVTAESYFYGLLEIIRQYRQRYMPVHLLISGGRKAMSVYATVAAAYLFGENDRVWTVLTEPHLMRAGIYHLLPEEQESVQIVELPMLPANVPAGAMTSIQVVLNRRSPRQRFLEMLTKQERVLAELLKQYPYESNEKLGKSIDKSARTIENQFRSMYGKMLDCFDLQIADNYKRQMLLDILMGRV